MRILSFARPAGAVFFFLSLSLQSVNVADKFFKEIWVGIKSFIIVYLSISTVDKGLLFCLFVTSNAVYYSVCHENKFNSLYSVAAKVFMNGLSEKEIVLFLVLIFGLLLSTL